MDNREAKQVLQALRANDLNTAQPTVIEALVLVENDPELKAWWVAQQSFDQKVAAKLKEVPIPADLRTNILAGSKIRPFTPPQPHFSVWLAAAALVALLCVAGTALRNSISGPLTQGDYAAAVLPLLNHDAPDLAMTSSDRDKIVAWLKERNAPMGTLPAGMSSLPPVGCQKYSVRGHTISLVCFNLAGGGLAHLFIIDEHDISDPFDNNLPEFNQTLGWATASWSDGKMSYLLATQAGSDVLKQLL